MVSSSCYTLYTATPRPTKGLRSTELYISQNFPTSNSILLPHVQEKLQKCGSKCKIHRLRQVPLQEKTQYNTIKHPLLSDLIRDFLELVPANKKST